MIDFIDVSIQYSGISLFENVNLKISNSDRVALVGLNGTGKSTLLKMISGKEPPESGKILKAKNIQIGYLPQEFINKSDLTLFDEVKNSSKVFSELSEKEKSLNDKLNTIDNNSLAESKIIEQLGQLESLKERDNFYQLDSQIGKILNGLGFSESDFNRKVFEFSGGWQMRIELAKILLGKNDIILLDEPTNHLDIDSLEWLISFLKSYSGALLIVSHDKHFVNNVTNRTLEIFNRKVSYYNGNYNSYINFKIQRDEQLQKDFKSQQQKIKDTKNFIERFRYKSTKAKQVQSRIKQLEKLDEIDIPVTSKKIDIRFPSPPPSGSVPVEIENLSKSFGNNTVLKNISLQINRGDKIALVGPNGAGKTTLSKIIASKLEPDSESVINYGHNSLVSYYSQEVTENLPLEETIIDALQNFSQQTTLYLRKLLGSFLFSDDDVFKPIKVLSGGEKSRIALAKILLTKANLIVLDEPTNHLDYVSKEVLQKALINYDETLLIVSHDVDFLEPIANSVIEVRDGSLKHYPGNINYYLFKKDEEKSQSNSVASDIPASKNINSKKTRKREEAKNRQDKFKATKDLKIKLDKIENSISELEKIKNDLEAELTMEKVYSNPELSKKKNNEYAELSKQLENQYSLWTDYHTKLDDLEKQFEL